MPILTNLADCQLNHDPKWNGIDVWPVITEEKKVDNRVLFWNFKGTQFCLRHGNWKLISTDDMLASNSQLYHIENDPYETTDLSLEKPEIVEKLMDQVAQQRRLDGTSQRNE